MNFGNAHVPHAIAGYGQKKSKPLDPSTMAQASPLKRDLLDGKSAEERKQYPVFEGVIGYFRDAIFRKAHVSWVGNEQHNKGQPLHWARGKSTDQMDCIMRHALAVDLSDMSDETEQHLASLSWRADAALQLYLERKYSITPPVNARSDD